MRRLLCSILLVALLPVSAFSVPLLQIYIEGASYDTDTDTWVTTSQNFKLWVIGDVTATKVSLGGGNFAYPGIEDVRLAVAHATNEVGSVTLSPTTTSLLPSPGDLSTPAAPAFFTSGNGNRPTMSDGTLLPSHGIYGAGTSWEAYKLGNFTAMDSKVGDFQYSFPGTFPDMGQVNVYDVAVTGYSQVHFDAYNHVFGTVNAKFAPLSHDGETGPPVPEPGTVVLLGAGLVTIASARFKRGRRRAR